MLSLSFPQKETGVPSTSRRWRQDHSRAVQARTCRSGSFRTRSAARCLGSSLLLVRHLLLEAMPAPSSVRSLLVAMHLFLVAYCFYPHIVSDSFLLLLVRPLLLVAMPFAPARCPGSICPCPSMAEPAWRKGEKRLDRGPCCATRPKGECRIGALRPRCNEKLLVTTGIATRSKDATRSSWSFY